MVFSRMEEGLGLLNYLGERELVLRKVVIIELVSSALEHAGIGVMIDVWWNACFSAEVAEDLELGVQRIVQVTTKLEVIIVVELAEVCENLGCYDCWLWRSRPVGVSRGLAVRLGFQLAGRFVLGLVRRSGFLLDIR